MATAIVCFLFYLMAKVCFIQPSLDQSTAKTLQDQGMDIANQQSVLESTKAKIHQIEIDQQKSADQILDQMKGKGLP